MKRVVCFLSALALAVGAIAPAAFASDAGYGQTDLIPLEDLDQETFDNYLAKFYSQDYPTYGVLDLIRDTFQGGLSNASGLNDSPWSWALNLVDNASDLGTEVGLWLRGVKIDPNTGMAIYPDDYLTDYAKDQLDTQLKSTAGSGDVTVGSGTWTYIPANTNSSWIRANAGHNIAYGNLTSHDVWIGRYLYNGNSWGTVVCSYTSGGTVRLYYNSLGSYDNFTSWSTYGTGKYYISRAISDSNISNNHPYYSSLNAALADFFDNSPSAPSGSWNGSGYYSDHQEGFSINLPSLPSTNWGNLSKYYYTTYGDQIVEGDNVDRYYYNIANNYAPYEISYELPYWLINGSSNVLDFNYDLDLPYADLCSVPSDFEGGSGFWDKSFSSLGGFGAFIMLGLSFGLVALFFKD